MTEHKSTVVDQHLPCPCGKSSDAYATYSDGHGYCHSCGKDYQDIENPVERKPKALSAAVPTEGTYQYVPWRGISREVMQTYDVRTRVENEIPKNVEFRYGNGRIQSRSRTEKKFWTGGELTSDTGYLFGSGNFARGSAKAITITEGALDCMSVYQMFGCKYPVVSVNSASTAKTDCSKDLDYLNSFDKIYLCFDNDEPGQKAVHAVASLFDFNKVYHVVMQMKDANEYLEKGKVDDFIKTWWGAKRFLPEGVVSTFKEMEDIIDSDEKKESVPYPFDTLNDMTYGIRTGEVILLKALEGIGKTEILRRIEYHLLKTTEANVGILHLEEDKARTLKGLAGYELRTPVHLPDNPASKDDIKNALHKAVGRDERVHIYSHFGSDDPDIILNTIRFLASSCGCKYIFLDHITMVVTGLRGEDERRALDYISTRLAMMVKELDFCLFMVSHVNDEGQTRGSRNIGKVAHLTISLSRDITSELPAARNTTNLLVEKNRYASKTGPSARLVFDEETFTIDEQLELPE